MTGATRIRVVIIDDVPEARDNVQKLLQFAGDVQVIGQGGTGREAIEIARKLHPDVILMDVSMPEMDGITATRHLREKPERRSLPVIMLTAKAMPDDQRQCLEAGANDYMAKPLDVEKLLSLVRVWMPR